MEQNKPDSTMHSDKQLVNAINGAIRMHIHAKGNVTPNDIGSLTKRIVGSIEGIVHASMVNHMKLSIEQQKFMVIAKEEYESLKQRDLQKQINFLVARLKEIDPEFNKKHP